MNKNIVKIFSIILILITLISISVNSFAAKAGSAGTGGSSGSSGDVVTSPGELKPKDEVKGEDELMQLGGNVMGILRTTGIVISVLILIVIGIKYMMGSAEEKAEYKKVMIPYLVGAALIFGASVISTVVFEFFTHLE